MKLKLWYMIGVQCVMCTKIFASRFNSYYGQQGSDLGLFKNTRCLQTYRCHVSYVACTTQLRCCSAKKLIRISNKFNNDHGSKNTRSHPHMVGQYVACDFEL